MYFQLIMLQSIHHGERFMTFLFYFQISICSTDQSYDRYFFAPPWRFFINLVFVWISTKRRRTLEYDTFAAAGWFLDTFAAANLSNAINLEITLIPSNMPQAMYAHQRTSLFVKLIANLHCFVPNICEGEFSLTIFQNIHHDWSGGCCID